MADWTLIRLFDQPAEDGSPLVQWCQVREGQAGEPETGSLQQVASQLNGGRVAVLVPGGDVAITSVQLPTQSRQRMLQAVPYALEEQLIDDVDDLHFALGARSDAGVAVAVVRVEQMQQWQSRYQAGELNPIVMLPDFLALEPLQDGWVLQVEDEQLLLRTGRQQGCVLDEENLSTLLPLLFEQATEKPSQLYFSRELPDQDWLVTWCASEQIELVEQPDQPLLAQAAKALDQGDFINLLQGRFSPSEQFGKVWRPWVPATALVLALVLIQFLAMTADYFRLSSQVAKLDSELEQIFRDALPDARIVPGDLRAQMESRLKQLNVASGGPELYALLDGLMFLSSKNIPYELQRLRYQNAELHADLELTDLPTLDRIKLAFQERPALVVEVVSASSRGDKVEARLLLKGEQ